MSTLAEQVVEQLKTDMDNVYDAGYQKGKSEGGGSYYDTFWDTFQKNGTQDEYRYAFAYQWNDNIYKPKYKIKPPRELIYTYFNSNITSVGTELDTSDCVDLYYSFCGSKIKTIQSLDCSKCTSFARTFSTCGELISLTLNNLLKTATFENTFDYCQKLETFLVSGEIGNAINLQWSGLLTVESVQSLINALADLTGQTTQTLTFHADVKAKLTDEQIATITSKNWTLA